MRDGPKKASRPGCLDPLFGAGCLLFVIGVSVGIGFGAVPELQVRDASTWEQAQATVVSARLEEDRSGEQCYRAVVEYTYEVDGEPLTCDAVDFLNPYYCDRSEAEAIIARFPEGSQVPAYYDPVAPDAAVLELESGRSLTVLIMSSATAILGAVMILLSLYRRRSLAKDQQA